MAVTAADIAYEPIRKEWAEALAAIERAAFPTAGIEDLLVTEEIEIYCDTFPEGGFVALHDDTPVGFGVGQREHGAVDQAVVDDHFGPFQQARRAQGQQVRVARAGTH